MSQTDRKNQNLEFSQKLSAKSEECLERRSRNLFAISRPTSASGGDIAVTESLHCNSKNPSYQNIPYRSNVSEDRFAEAENTETTHSDNSNSLEIKSNLCTSDRRRSKYVEVGSKLKAELSKYKKELKEYNNTTKDLEDKYMKINFELTEMQQKHDRFVANRSCSLNDCESCSDCSSSSTTSTGSEYSLRRKYTQIFHRGNSFMTMLPPISQSSCEHLNLAHTQNDSTSPATGVNLHRKKRKSSTTTTTEYNLRNISNSVCPQIQKLQYNISLENTSNHQNQQQQHVHKKHSKRKLDNKENETPASQLPPPLIPANCHGLQQSANIKDMYAVLKNVLDTNSKAHNVGKSVDLNDLHGTISTMHTEQTQLRNIIQQQQGCLQDYHSRCLKAQQIMQTQQKEIDKLNTNNQKLETEISTGIDQLREKIDLKLRDVSHLPQLVRDEQSKYEKAAKENAMLVERLQTLQDEASHLKMKIEDLGRRKVTTTNRLKTAERDLKIFKNYNTALKHEKRKLSDDLHKLKEQLDSVQSASKKSLARQREQNEKQRRDLQKRVFELELKLSRSQNSTTGLIQERDSLIAELQTQLNTLVHNFEVSQKHIRVLRRHIYSMTGGSVRSNSRILNEPM